MLRLMGSYGAANLAPHMVLEEFGLDYEFVLVDTSKYEHRKPAYLKLNPNGRVPTLIDGEDVLYEAAAICLYLADKKADSRLVPPFGSVARGHLYKWLMFLTNTLQPALLGYFYAGRYSTDPAHASAIKAQAEITATQLYRQLDQELMVLGPYLLGDTLSIVDFYLLMLVRWGRFFVDPPVKVFPNLARHAALLSERPSVQRAFAQEHIPSPYCLEAP